MRTANTHIMSLRIRATWSGIGCLLKKICAKTCELSLRHMTTVNTHMSLHFCAAWSGLCCLQKISKTKAYLMNIKFDWTFVAFDVII